MSLGVGKQELLKVVEKRGRLPTLPPPAFGGEAGGKGGAAAASPSDEPDLAHPCAPDFQLGFSNPPSATKHVPDRVPVNRGPLARLRRGPLEASPAGWRQRSGKDSFTCERAEQAGLVEPSRAEGARPNRADAAAVIACPLAWTAFHLPVTSTRGSLSESHSQGLAPAAARFLRTAPPPVAATFSTRAGGDTAATQPGKVMLIPLNYSARLFYAAPLHLTIPRFPCFPLPRDVPPLARQHPATRPAHLRRTALDLASTAPAYALSCPSARRFSLAA